MWIDVRLLWSENKKIERRRITNDKKTISAIKQSFLLLAYDEIEDKPDDTLPYDIEIYDPSPADVFYYCSFNFFFGDFGIFILTFCLSRLFSWLNL